MKIVTVLRSGGDYKPEHVERLRRMCQEYIPQGEFVCLSDVQGMDVTTIELVHGWPGWWSKIEAFMIPGPVLFFDLDTSIVGSCDSWLNAIIEKPFVTLRDVYRGRDNPFAVQSSIMYWSGDMSYLYEKFKARPDCSIPGGDQIFIQTNLRQRAAFLQDYTDSILSYKADIRDGSRCASEASVVFFHGKPRPWEQTDVCT